MALRRFRVACILGILALAFHALWPLLAQAKPTQPGILVPVCTVEGITHHLELPAGKTPLEDGSAAHFDHCTLCVFGADRATLQQGWIFFLERTPAVEVPLAGTMGFSTTFPLAGLARAPPFLPFAV